MASTDNPVLRAADDLHELDLVPPEPPRKRYRIDATIPTTIGAVDVSTHVVDQLRTRLDTDIIFSLPGNTFFERTVFWMRESMGVAVPAGLRDTAHESKKILRHGKKAKYLAAPGWIFVIVENQDGARCLVTAYPKDDAEISRLYHLRPSGEPAPAPAAPSAVTETASTAPEDLAMLDLSATPLAPLDLSATPSSDFAAIPSSPGPLRPIPLPPEVNVNMHICMETGHRNVAIDFNEDERAKYTAKQVFSFLKVASVTWKGVDYVGGPHTQPNFLSVKMHQKRLRLRVGRYIGTITDAIHEDGHPMKHEEIFAAWNLREYQRKLNGADSPENAAPASAADSVQTLCADHERMTEFLRLCYENRQPDDTLAVHQVGDVLRDMGINVRQGTVKTVLDRQQSLGWLALLDEDRKLFGFDNAGLELLGIDPKETAAPYVEPPVAVEPPEPAAALPTAPPVPATALSEVSTPAALVMLKAAPVPPPAAPASALARMVEFSPLSGELQSLFSNAAPKLQQLDAALARKGEIQASLAANEEARLRLEDERAALFLALEETEVEIGKGTAIKQALEALRAATAAA